jgi:hypothetical protein
MMSIIIGITQKTIKAWLDKGDIDISGEVNTLITECVLQCVFGVNSENLEKLGYVAGRETKEMSPG